MSRSTTPPAQRPLEGRRRAALPSPRIARPCETPPSAPRPLPLRGGEDGAARQDRRDARRRRDPQRYPFDKQRCLVTGGGSGIGAAVARAFLDNGPQRGVRRWSPAGGRRRSPRRCGAPPERPMSRSQQGDVGAPDDAARMVGAAVEDGAAPALVRREQRRGVRRPAGGDLADHPADSMGARAEHEHRRLPARVAGPRCRTSSIPSGTVVAVPRRVSGLSGD